MGQDFLTDAELVQRDKRIAGIAYALYALAVFGFWIPSIAGLVINYLKVHETSAMIASHHRWMIRTFWWGTLWIILGVSLVIIMVGYLILVALMVWWIYRVIRGSLALHEDRSMPA